jgi:hypothetical protein
MHTKPSHTNNKNTQSDSLSKFASKQLPCDIIVEELCAVDSTEVKDHFKKTIAEKEALLGSSAKPFFVKMSEKVKKQPITDYKRMHMKKNVPTQ